MLQNFLNRKWSYEPTQKRFCNMETMYGHDSINQKKMNCGEIYILQMTYISNMKTKIVILEIHSYARHWEKKYVQSTKFSAV